MGYRVPRPKKPNFDKFSNNLNTKIETGLKERISEHINNSVNFKDDLLKYVKPQDNIKGHSMNQFLTLDIGSNKATIDLSKVRKQGLIFEKSMFGKKPKIVIYYNDRPDTPEVNFELNSEEEAEKVYNDIQKKLNRWAEDSNSARLQLLEKELDIMKEQKEALLEEKQVLMDVFNQFKEMMQIMEDDTKTSSLVDVIKEM